MAGKSLKGTKSHTNLKEAFAGESQANRRYLYFASVADIEGLPDMAGPLNDPAAAEAPRRIRRPALLYGARGTGPAAAAPATPKNPRGPGYGGGRARWPPGWAPGPPAGTAPNRR